jgi:hypothetical protein
MLSRNRALFASLLLVGLTGCDKANSGGAAAPVDPTQQQQPQGQAQGLVTKIDGAPAAGQSLTTDSVTLALALDGDAAQAGLTMQGFQCRFSADGEFKACGPSSLVLSNLANGTQLDLTVRAVLKDQAGNLFYAQESTVSIKVAIPAGTKPGENPIAGALSNELLVGNAYQMTVPAGKHVTEYSSSKTTGVLKVFRILNESDPYYLGNYKCDAGWDSRVTSMSAAGDLLGYCFSTPTRDAFKDDNEFRLANNHVEISTDAALVTKDNEERLSFSVFDADIELTAARSRFANACTNSQRHSITVPMIPNFFLGTNPEAVDFWWCDTYLSDVNGAPQLWRVGAFYDVDHIDWNSPNLRYSRAVEAVYMVRANAAVFEPDAFAKQAQTRILSAISKVTP